MKIICILGRSGSGKSSIERKLESIGYNRLISYTTRGPRGQERNGVDYHFVTREEFESLIENDILMEYAEYNGNYYGSPKPVGSINNVIVVEARGYEKIKQLYGEQAVGVYVDTPMNVIDKRIKDRGDTDSAIAKSRKLEDNRVFSSIKDKVDIVVDGTKPVDISVIQILKNEGCSGYEKV